MIFINKSKKSKKSKTSIFFFEFIRNSDRILKKTIWIVNVFSSLLRSRITSIAFFRNEFRYVFRVFKFKIRIEKSTNEKFINLFFFNNDVVINEISTKLITKIRTKILKKNLMFAQKIQKIKTNLRVLNVNRKFIFFIFVIFIIIVNDRFVNFNNDLRFRFLTTNYFMIFVRIMSNIQHRKFNIKNILKFIIEFAINSQKFLKIKNMLKFFQSFEMFC